MTDDGAENYNFVPTDKKTNLMEEYDCYCIELSAERREYLEAIICVSMQASF